MAETDDPDVLRNLATDYALAKRWADLLALEPGLATRTPYGTLAAQPLHYVLR